jgi:hypothetical protein
LGRRSLDLNRAHQSLRFVLRVVTSVFRSVGGTPNYGTRHIRYHFLRDHQQRGDIEIVYINTKEQLADIFTKLLDEKTFTKLRHELNILDSRNFD